MKVSPGPRSSSPTPPATPRPRDNRNRPSPKVLLRPPCPSPWARVPPPTRKRPAPLVCECPPTPAEIKMTGLTTFHKFEFVFVDIATVAGCFDKQWPLLKNTNSCAGSRRRVPAGRSQ